MKKVYIIARQSLIVNSRIFKQASSLVGAGYEVHVVGNKKPWSPAEEERDGFYIHRLEVKPFQYQLRAYRRAHAPKPPKPRVIKIANKRLGWVQFAYHSPWRLKLHRQRLHMETAGIGLLVAFIRKFKWVFMDIAFNLEFYRRVMADPVPPTVIHSNDLHSNIQ